MVRNRSGPITSTSWPIASSSPVTVVIVRTTPLTCGFQASVTTMMRDGPASASPRSAGANAGSAEVSGSLRHPRLRRRVERQTVQRRPVDQFQTPVLMFNQRGAAFHPVTAVQVLDRIHLTHFGVVNVPADDPVEAAPPGLGSQRTLETIDRLYCLFHLPLQPRRQRPVGIAQAAAHGV